ncbi:MAG TPA: hypothetical protein VLD67_18270 [Vicinamibacterales bacterium]|nr:hypothetical protein [Vicinamibacterales bacterium]
MRSIRHDLAILLLAPLAISAVRFPAVLENPGVVFEIEVKDASNAPPQTMTAAVEGKNVKLQPPAEGRDRRGDLIFRGDRREMLIVSHADRSYMVVDEAMMKELAGAMAKMDAMFANMPPEQRAMAEKMMRGRMGGGAGRATKRELRRTAEQATHNGFPTVKYEMLEDGRKAREYWVTPWNNLEGFEEAKPAFEAMARFGKGLQDALGQSQMMRGLVDFARDGYELMAELDGYPVVTRQFSSNGQLESETTLRSVRRETFSPADFEPPSEYSRRSLGR